MNHKEIAAKVASLSAEYDLARRQVRIEQKAVKTHKRKLVSTQEAQRILQAVAKETQQAAHGKIAAIASRCLETVFEDKWRLGIKFVESRGKTEARLGFIRDRDGLEIEDPLDEDSAGKISVAVFSLRLADVMLSEPRKRRLLVLDEPFSGVEERLVPKVAEMLMRLSKELELQIVLTTHNKGFQIGKVVHIGK